MVARDIEEAEQVVISAKPDWWVPSSKYLEPPYVEGWHDVTAFGDTKRVYVRANDGWRLDE